MHHPSTNKSVVMIRREFNSYSQDIFQEMALKRSTNSWQWSEVWKTSVQFPAIPQVSSVTFGKLINVLMPPFNTCKIAMKVFSTLQHHHGDQCSQSVLQGKVGIRCCGNWVQASAQDYRRNSLCVWCERGSSSGGSLPSAHSELNLSF